ncbi:MAG: energy transducer TonB, partial [Acidobacteriia bacterium]|nr:energy transducer TonB [Terriglobia bacterium]
SPDPEYPREASQRFKDEKVVLFIVVGSDGVPRDIKVARPLAPNVDQAAIEAVKKWKFRPATLDGKAVAVRINIELPVKP